MKKLLFLVLIFIAICSSFETDIELESFDWKKFWDSVKSVIKKAVDFLKNKGLYYPILNALKKNKRSEAVAVCKSKGVPVGVYNEMIDLVNTFI